MRDAGLAGVRNVCGVEEGWLKGWGKNIQWKGFDAERRFDLCLSEPVDAYAKSCVRGGFDSGDGKGKHSPRMIPQTRKGLSKFFPNHGEPMKPCVL